jgi:Mrp family chromosome partitioning ATPase
VSKNYQLLTQLERNPDLFRVDEDSVTPPDVKRSAFDLDALQHEEVKKLIQRIFLLPSNGSAPRAVVFCGIDGGEGSGWICAHAGEILASQNAGTVCMLDANLRSPSLHAHFRVNNTRGLSDALLQTVPIRDFAHRLGENLWLVPGGSSPPDLRSQPGTENLHTQFAELREQFNYVLISAPPVGLYNDALLLGRVADGVVFVLEANSTRKETARKAKESAELAQVRLLGAVLNKRTFPIPQALYQKL